MNARPAPQTNQDETLHEMLFARYGMLGVRKANYNDLTGALHQLLVPKGISISCCDIFEETLLKEAGVVTQPTKCFFKSASPDMVEFEFQGITCDDLLKFATYYDKQTGDKYLSRTSFDTSTNTGHMAVALDVVYNKFLPAFKAAFPSIPQEKLDHYSDLSKNDDDVSDYNLLQSILVLINSTIQLTDNKLKAGMLTILHAQLQHKIETYRMHYFHNRSDCSERSTSTASLYSELNNFMQQADTFPALHNDANIESVKQFIQQYADLQDTKLMKAFFEKAVVSAAQSTLSASDLSSKSSSLTTGSEDNLSSTSDTFSAFSLSDSEPASPRSDSPLRSVARLFATSPSHSRAGSTASLSSSDTSTEIVSLFDTDSDCDLRGDTDQLETIALSPSPRSP